MHKHAFVFLIAALLLPCKTQGADCPQWGGSAARNMVSPEKNLPETFEPGQKKGDSVDLATAKNVKWAVHTGNFSCGTPAIAGGKVFQGAMISGSGVLNCFDEATGKLLWQWIKPCRTDMKENPEIGRAHV